MSKEKPVRQLSQEEVMLLATFNDTLGKTISALTLDDDNVLHVSFEDGSKIKLFDDSQS